MFRAAVVTGVLAPTLLVIVVLLTSSQQDHGSAIEPGVSRLAEVDHRGGNDWRESRDVCDFEVTEERRRALVGIFHKLRFNLTEEWPSFNGTQGTPGNSLPFSTIDKEYRIVILTVEIT